MPTRKSNQNAKHDFVLSWGYFAGLGWFIYLLLGYETKGKFLVFSTFLLACVLVCLSAFLLAFFLVFLYPFSFSFSFQFLILFHFLIFVLFLSILFFFLKIYVYPLYRLSNVVSFFFPIVE